MKTSDSNSSSRNRSRGRRGRRGGRSHSNQGPSSSSSRSGGSYSSGGSSKSTRQPAKPKTLWEKIVAFFTGGDKPAAKSQSKPAPRNNGPVVDTRPISAPKLDSKGSSAAAPAAPRAKRVPEQVEVTSSRLYVGNLSFDAGESDLLELFNGVGQVQYAEVVSNPHTHRSKGFAFVQMNTIEEAKRAVRELHNKDFMGRPLVVSGAKSQREDAPAEEASAASA